VGSISIFIVLRQDEGQQQIIKALSDQDDFYIAGIEKDEACAIIKTERLKPDFIILDILSIEMSWLELIPIIRRKSPSTAIIILCSQNDDELAKHAVLAGVSGCLFREDIDKLAIAIRTVNSGGMYVYASIMRKILDSVSKITPQTSCNFFSSTERGIIISIAQGLTDNEIAKNLNYSPGTIKNFITIIKRKTNLKSRIQVVIYSILNGFVDLHRLDFGIKYESSAGIKEGENYENCMWN